MYPICQCSQPGTSNYLTLKILSTQSARCWLSNHDGILSPWLKSSIVASPPLIHPALLAFHPPHIQNVIYHLRLASGSSRYIERMARFSDLSPELIMELWEHILHPDDIDSFALVSKHTHATGRTFLEEHRRLKAQYSSIQTYYDAPRRSP